jgi:restriction system protein
MRRNRRKKKDESYAGMWVLMLIFLYYLYQKGISAMVLNFVTIALLIAGVLFIRRQNDVEIQKLLSTGIDIIDKMEGEEFEVFLLKHFKRKGYNGKTTPLTNDYGADLVLFKDGKTIVVQVKRWSNAVGIEAIQQVIGSKAYYDATNMWVITNNYFTQQAQNLAIRSGVELWDRDKLLKYLEINKAREELSAYTNSNRCPRCNASLITKHGRRGPFCGCSNYPRCNYTRSL